MSLDQPRPNAPGIDFELTDEERADREPFSATKFSKGPKGASQRAQELFGVSLSEHYFRRACSRKQISYNVIGHVVHISDRQLYDHVVLGTRRNAQTEVSA